MADADAVASALGGTIVLGATGSCVVIDREYGARAHHGVAQVEDWAVDSARGARHLSLLSGRACQADHDGRSLLFFDLETTGLAGGAGTRAFLIGFGWFDDRAFRTRQIFLGGLEAERPLLGAAGAEIERAGALVSFNGKTFDVPVLETRFLFHRMAVPFTTKMHVDMLHPARRLWSGRESCALRVLERELLGVRRQDDVSGAEIPARFFAYVRTGRVSALGPVLEHNRLDLLSLAGLTARAARVVEEGPAAARDARECLGLGRIYDRAGWGEQAAACYERIATCQIAADDLLRIEALRCLALRLRRERRHPEAAAAWQYILDYHPTSSTAAREAVAALAIHHEHRSRDLAAAHAFALRAAGLGEAATPACREQARYRLARLERKLRARPLSLLS